MYVFDRKTTLAWALFLGGLALPARAQTIDVFPTPSQPSFPFGITAGPDGNVWFVETQTSGIGRITPDGDITEFPSGAVGAVDITAGPDGNLWFVHSTGVGRITTAGVVTLFPTPTPPGAGLITTGPDGNIWCTETGGNRIARVTPSGTVTEFPLPRPSSQPFGITAGPDGNLWFTELGFPSIGRITPSGVITEFPIPGFAWQIITGPDGDLWYTDEGNYRISTISTAGDIVQHFGMPTRVKPQGITVTSGGTVWFSSELRNFIGSLSPSGLVSYVALPHRSPGPGRSWRGRTATSGSPCNRRTASAGCWSSEGGAHAERTRLTGARSGPRVP